MTLLEHMARFLIDAHSGQEWASYRRRCFAFWRTHYGSQVADAVERLVQKAEVPR